MQADVHRTKIAQTEHPVLVLQQVMPCGPRADQIVRFVTSTILFYDEHVIDPNAESCATLDAAIRRDAGCQLGRVLASTGA